LKFSSFLTMDKEVNQKVLTPVLRVTDEIHLQLKITEYSYIYLLIHMIIVVNEYVPRQVINI